MHLATNVDDHERVEAWRLHCLINAGLESWRAEMLAERTDINLHQALQLIRAGCDHKTLLRILL